MQSHHVLAGREDAKDVEDTQKHDTVMSQSVFDLHLQIFSRLRVFAVRIALSDIKVAQIRFEKINVLMLFRN